MNLFSNYKGVYAVVVTFNGEKWVHKCIRSLANSNYPVTCIVVDNGSTDQTVPIIETQYPDVILIKNKENSGFAGGNNIGISLALEKGADFVFLLNQDAWVDQHAIAELVAASEKHTNYGIISPLHFAGSGTTLDRAFNNYVQSQGLALKDPTGSSLFLLQDKKVYETDFINAAAWMITRACLQKVGGFSPIFRHYGEDRDYVQRLHFHQLKLGFIRSAKIYHDREGRSFDVSRRAIFLWYYQTGSAVRLADMNSPFLWNWVRIFAWILKDCTYHFFSGKWFAFPAFFQIHWNLFTQRTGLIEYRRTLASKRQYLFISDRP